jgi:hypothetical protein
MPNEYRQADWRDEKELLALIVELLDMTRLMWAGENSAKAIKIPRPRNPEQKAKTAFTPENSVRFFGRRDG